MVQQPRRGKRRRKLLGSHQRCWIWGRFPVLETLRAGRWNPRELKLSERLSSAERAAAAALAERGGCKISPVPHEELTKLCGSTEHQGYAAKMPPYPFADAAGVIASAGEHSLFVLLDAIQDPFNYGAILRSADAAGIDAVIVGSQGQSDVTSQVVRSSAGAVNHLPIAQVDDLPAAAAAVRERGLRIVGASEKAGVPVDEFDFRQPAVLVVGNEGSGIRPELLQLCDATVTIPQYGGVASLNAAVSAGILFYEARRQRGAPPRGSRPRPEE